MVYVNNYLKLLWISETGVPAHMIYGHPGVPIETPSIGNISSSDVVNNMGVSLEAGGIYPFGNGTNMYGNEAKNNDNRFFQKIKNVNSNWGIFETNGVALNLVKPESFNEYYKTLQQSALHAVRFLSPLAWHVGYGDGGAQNLGATKVRDTAYEDAIREFVSTYGVYPITDMVWEFGMATNGCVDKTGITNCNAGLNRTQLEGWTFSGYNNSKLENGVVSLIVNNSDPQFISPNNLSYQGTAEDTISFILKVTGDGQKIPAEVFFQTENEKFWGQTKAVPFNVIADNDWHRYVVNVGNNSKWVNNKVYQIRLDVGGMNSNVNIDLVRISTRPNLTYDFNLDGTFSDDDLKSVPNLLFNVSSGQPNAKEIRLDTVIDSLKYKQ